VKWLAFTLAVIAVAGLLWGAGEWHYRSCVDAAKARNPIVVTLVPARPTSGSYFGPATRSITRGEEGQNRAVGGCSRLPW
jgi:hypothetical protein